MTPIDLQDLAQHESVKLFYDASSELATPYSQSACIGPRPPQYRRGSPAETSCGSRDEQGAYAPSRRLRLSPESLAYGRCVCC